MDTKKIHKLVTQYTKTEIASNTRKRQNVYARAIYFKLCKELTKLTLKEIGQTLNKTHATVLHSINNIFPAIKLYDKKLYKIYTELTNNDEMPIEQRYAHLKEKYNNLKKQNLPIQYSNLINIIGQIPNNEIQNAELRFNTIKDMLVNKNKQ
ncbi:MAG: putative bacterial DnaA helix-turn-helix protein [Prokaryotic dsDNA virus sp.]|nr:MAG: putative bacterial DnaA helix-turn-helix protein [Prokaryotic dsDNA virus sp.]|tara:strand:- start:25362 stop:25817 length:456 start_codon:yes stop_codon:yes gene_type:complete